MSRCLRRAGLEVSLQRFAVPGRGRSRNVIGELDGPASCLHILMAHADSTPDGPGANDNASGLGVLAALAGRLDGYPVRCDVWLVATGAEERVYTGSADHLGALALARRVRASEQGRLRWALSLDEVGRDRPFWLRSPARPAARVEGACSSRGARARCRSAGCATRAAATPTTASSSCWGYRPRSWAWARAVSRVVTAPATAPGGFGPRRYAWRAGSWRPRWSLVARRSMASSRASMVASLVAGAITDMRSQRSP